MEKQVILTPAQMERLKPYEKNMETAVRSDWTRGLGRTGYAVLSDIQTEVIGHREFINLSCPVCCLNLVRTVGRWYFANKAIQGQKGAETSVTPSPKKKGRRIKSNA